MSNALGLFAQITLMQIQRYHSDANTHVSTLMHIDFDLYICTIVKEIDLLWNPVGQ